MISFLIVPAMRSASGLQLNISPCCAMGWLLAAGWAQCLPIFLVPLEFLLSTLGHSPPATLIRPTLPPRKLPASILRILFSVSDSFLFVYFCIIISIVTGFSYAHNCSSGNRKHSDLENNTIVLLLQYTLLTSQIVYISYVLAQSWLQLFDIQCIELAFAKV